MALSEMGFDSEALQLSRDQVTMLLFKTGYVQNFNMQESQATNHLCNMIETPKKVINSRDLKIIILAFHKLWFDWMKLANPNVNEEDKISKEIGFIYKEKYYLNSREEVKALNRLFKLFLQNK